MGTFDALSIGAKALLAQQDALQIAGHNIANVNTPGYSRQRVDFSAALPQIRSYGILGRGVEISTIGRMADEYLESRLRDASSGSKYLETLETAYKSLEVFFNELTDSDLSSAFNTFNGALSDLANNVEDESTRGVVVEQAQTFAEFVRNLAESIRQFRYKLDEDASIVTERINTLTRNIADLNYQITNSEGGGALGVSANDLRDKRGEALKELSGLISIKTHEDPNGAVNVSVGGRLLVFQGESFEVATIVNDTTGLPVHDVVLAEDKSRLVLTAGKLHGILEARDSIIPGFQKELDTLAGTYMWEFNKIHTGGVGLKGFSSVTAVNGVEDLTTALDKVGFYFNPVEGTYKIQNGSFTLNVRNEVTGEVKSYNVDVDLDGYGNNDTVLDDPASGRGLVQLINGLGSHVVASTNPRNQLALQSDSSSYTFTFANDTSNALAALGIGTFFKGYDAATMDVNDTLVADDGFVAAGKSFAAGDNANVLALLDLRDAKLYQDGSRNFEDYYQGIVGRLGIESSRTTSRKTTQDDVLAQLANEREALSGVSVDEELVNVLQYQRSYQAAARFVTSLNAILETLLNM